MTEIMRESFFPPASFGLDASLASSFHDFSKGFIEAEREINKNKTGDAMNAKRKAEIELGRALNPFIAREKLDLQSGERFSANLKISEGENEKKSIENHMESITNETNATDKLRNAKICRDQRDFADHEKISGNLFKKSRRISPLNAREEEEQMQREEEKKKGMSPSSSMEFFEGRNESEGENSEEEEALKLEWIAGDEDLAHMLLHLRNYVERSHSDVSPLSSSCSEGEENSLSFSDEEEYNEKELKEAIRFEGMGQIKIKYNFGEKDPSARKSSKSLNKNKLKQKRCSGACSEHKRRHQRCPMECPNRKRDELLLSSLNKSSAANAIAAV